MLIVFMSFSSSAHVADWTKCILLNDEPRMIRPTLIELHPVKIKYYPFMISSDKCTGICNIFSPKMCLPIETKDISVKAFNMIIKKNWAKRMAKYISCDCKYKFNSTACNSNKKWNNKTCQCECKNYRKCKKDYS